MFPEILLQSPSTFRRLTDPRQVQAGGCPAVAAAAGGSECDLGRLHSDGFAVSADSI